MLIKLDENLGRTPQAELKARGHDAERVTEEGLSGESDLTVWERCQKEGRFFITLDLDFSDVRRFPPGSHAGILLLRPSSNSTAAVMATLRRVLDEGSLESLARCLAVTDPTTTRIRRPPSEAPQPPAS